MPVWVTRNKHGEVIVFEQEPKYDGTDWYHDNPRAASLYLADDEYREVACGACCQLHVCLPQDPRDVPDTRVATIRRARRRSNDG